MRNMSFALTTPQVITQTKTVTRRLGWSFLKPHDRLRAVKKAMGLKKGEKIETLAILEVVSVTREPLSAITQADVTKEGFGHLTPAEFIAMLSNHYAIQADTEFNRIEFKYPRSDAAGAGENQ
jgi:hypothetical protein